MVKVTVTLCTKRKDPKIEYAIQSLNEQTFKDFEYIIVDCYYNNRKNEILNLIKDSKANFPILYIPDKPSRWRGILPQISNARNTALIFANGKYIVNHDDCTKMPKNWLENHLKYLEQGYLVAGSWIGYQFTNDKKEGVIGAYGQESRIKITKVPIKTTATWFYGQNCSYPLEDVLDINGFDEDLDGEIGQEDLNLAFRLEKKGFKIMYDPTNITDVHMITHGYEKLIPPVNIKLKDGKEHFSNEFFMQKFFDEGRKLLPYGNPFNLKDIREMIKKYNINTDLEIIYKNMESYINPNKYDWRDGRLIEDKIKD